MGSTLQINRKQTNLILVHINQKFVKAWLTLSEKFLIHYFFKHRLYNVKINKLVAFKVNYLKKFNYFFNMSV